MVGSSTEPTNQPTTTVVCVATLSVTMKLYGSENVLTAAAATTTTTNNNSNYRNCTGHASDSVHVTKVMLCRPVELWP